MPFTVSHVAAVLPAHRPLTRARVFTAAVIGSMAPDFGLLVPGFLSRLQTHSLASLLTFSLPAGLLSYWLTLLLARPAVVEVAPDGVYLRLRAQRPASILRLHDWLAAAAAILFGAITHLVWDGFTHEDARGVRMFPMLEDYGPEMAGHPLHLYRWLQYGSSLVGLAAVLFALLLWLRHAPAPAAPPARRLLPAERAVWMFLYLLPPLAGMARVIAHPPAGLHSAFASGFGIGWIAIAGMRGCVVSLLLVSLLIRARLSL